MDPMGLGISWIEVVNLITCLFHLEFWLKISNDIKAYFHEQTVSFKEPRYSMYGRCTHVYHKSKPNAG